MNEAIALRLLLGYRFRFMVKISHANYLGHLSRSSKNSDVGSTFPKGSACGDGGGLGGLSACCEF